MVQILMEQDMPHFSENTSAAAEQQDEELKSEYSNERIEMILAQSRKVVQDCGNTIDHVAQTQAKFEELREGIQQVNARMERFEEVGQKLTKQVTAQLQGHAFGSRQSRF